MAKSAKGPVDIFAGIKNVKFEGQPPEQTERIKPDINSDKKPSNVAKKMKQIYLKTQKIKISLKKNKKKKKKIFL